MYKKKSLIPLEYEVKKADPIGTIKVDDQARQDMAKFREEIQKSALRRIVFAFDATGSRSHVWEMAKSVQAKMLAEALQYGNVEIQIVAFRDKFVDRDYLEYSDWSQDGLYLENFMGGVVCDGGGGNDGESVDIPLKMILDEESQVNAVILVGDEPVHPSSRAEAYKYAEELGRKGIPIFAFHEGNRLQAKIDFQKIAEKSGGIYDQFTPNSKIDFGDRLRVVTIFGTGGKHAVDDFIKKSKIGNRQLSSGAQELAKRLLAENHMR